MEVSLNTVARIYPSSHIVGMATVFFNNGKKPIDCSTCIEFDHPNATLKIIPYDHRKANDILRENSNTAMPVQQHK